MVSLPWPAPVRGQWSSSKSGGEPINCRFMDIKCSSNLVDRFSLCEQLGGDSDLLRIQLARLSRCTGNVDFGIVRRFTALES